MTASHTFRGSNIATAIAAVLLVAQVALASMAWWHHHDECDSHRGECAVCIAAASNTIDDLPAPSCPMVPCACIGELVVSGERDGSAATVLRQRARAPPAR